MPEIKTKPNMLIILDGLGISFQKKYNAFFQAHTPYLDTWQHQYFYTTLQASGEFVGLPNGHHGNSQVGHFTLGAGAIIEQTIALLNNNLQVDILHCNYTLTELLQKFNHTSRIHLLGMVSDGNIHSNIKHAQAFIKVLLNHQIADILVHAFLDGRDCPPRSALDYLAQLEKDLKQTPNGRIASIHGRYYAMDRNNNEDRTQATFDILTKQQRTYTAFQDVIAKHYTTEFSDEFIKPTACIQDHTILPGDAIIFFNFRPDRAIQLTKKLLTLDLAFFITPVIYDLKLQTTPLIQEVCAHNTLLEIVSNKNKKIFSIAETEKYAHISYFFNGHKDILWPRETRILIPSSPIQPVEDPCMQAEQITQTVLNSLHDEPQDFYLINYANADMVGHSGNLPATIKAIEFLDIQLAKLYQKVVVEQEGIIYITADHGNAEMMFDPTSQQPCTSHTSNPVPFYMLTDNQTALDHATQWQGVGLADVAQLIIRNIDL